MNDCEHEMHPQSRTEVWLEKILEAVKEGGGGGGGLPTPEVDGAALISSNGQWIQRPGYEAYYEELVQATGGYPDYASLYKAYRVCDLPELPDDLDVGSVIKMFMKEEVLEAGVVVESEEFYQVASIMHATDSVIGFFSSGVIPYIAFVKEDGASIVTYYEEEYDITVEFQFEKAGVYLLYFHDGSDGGYEFVDYAYGWSFDPDAESPDFTWDGKLVYQKTIDQKLTMPIPASSGSVLVYVDGEYVPQSGYGYESPYVEHTWDGNTEGLPQIGETGLYRVGDPLDFKVGDIVEVSVVVVHDGEEEETVDQYSVSDYRGMLVVDEYVYIAKEDTYVSGIEVPRGLYFVGDTRDPNNAMYVSKISGGGVTKMDPKYLPMTEIQNMIDEAIGGAVDDSY